MAISESEAGSLIDQIELSIRETATQQDKPRILQLMHQWRSDVEAGRPIERKLNVRPSPGIDLIAEVPRSRSTSTGDFVGKEDFSKVEQLDMLITALGIAFIAPQMMATRFLDAISDFSAGPETKAQYDPVIRLVSDVDDAEAGHGAPISRSSVEQSILHTQWLGQLLAEIAEEAEFAQRRLTDVGEKI